MSKGGSTININFRGGSGGGVQKNNYPSSSRSHGNIGSGESHGGSGNDGGGYGFSHNNSHGYGGRGPSREALAAATRYEAAQAAQQAQAAQAQAAAQEAQQAAQAVQEALQKAKASQAQYEYETKVAEMLQQTRAAAKVSQVSLAEASKPRTTASEAWEMVQKAIVSFNKANEDQIKNNQAALKWKDPSILAQSPIWPMMDQQSRDLAARNYNAVLHNQGVFARAFDLHKTLYEHSRKVYELAQEDEYNVVPTGIKFKRSDVDTAERSVVIAQKFISLYKEKAKALDVFKTQPAIVAKSHAMAGYWGYTEKARQKLKDSVLDHVNWDEMYEAPAIKAIQSFATAEKQWVLLNKPAAQKEFDFFHSSLGYFPRADFATITKLNLSNSCMDDDNVLGVTSALTILPNLKYLDVSGNKITVTGEGFLVKALQKFQQEIKILLYKFKKLEIVEEAKDQGDLIFGSKEERQEAIKHYLNRAKGNGVDVDNIVATKDIWTAIKTGAKVSTGFIGGLIKCNLGYDSVEEFAAKEAVAAVSKKAANGMFVLDFLTCYFETFDEYAISKEGIQYMHDIKLIETGEFIEHVE
ncbi:MAG: hypothetical protein RL662_142 [Bacteroidota bacterium]|jgi:chemotaxis protein histidine kinase CheA